MGSTEVKLWVWKASGKRWRGHAALPWCRCYGHKVAQYLRTHKVRSISLPGCEGRALCDHASANGYLAVDW